jgi:tRNA 2-thiouridine synthesizing protein A
MDEGIKHWQADRTLDAIGLACPLPVLKARKILAGMKPGERLMVVASDPMAAIDVPHMCRQDGHDLEQTARSPAASGVRLFFLIAVNDGPGAGLSLGED